MNGKHAELFVGAAGNEGDIHVRDNRGNSVFHMNGEHAKLVVGSAGNEGDIIVRDQNGRDVFHFNAEFAVCRIGAAGNEGDLILHDDAGNESIHLNGGAGDIILRNADLAEQFELADGVEATPGTVMAVDHDGLLVPAEGALATTVVGVIAGAGRTRPGIVMDHRPGDERRVPVAMVGKAAVRVDAGFGAIRPGDLLAASPTPGHAMRADVPKAGAIIGKALTPLGGGRGLVEMLVALQ
jgi:hypothetical protein